MSIKNMSLCKKLQYWVLYNKKLDWLKRNKHWKIDRIDGYVGAILLSLLLLAPLFTKAFILPLMMMFYVAILILEIRHIKSLPADIENQFRSKFRCIAFVFILLLLVSTVFMALGALV